MAGRNRFPSVKRAYSIASRKGVLGPKEGISALMASLIKAWYFLRFSHKEGVSASEGFKGKEPLLFRWLLQHDFQECFQKHSHKDKQQPAFLKLSQDLSRHCIRFETHRQRRLQ